MIDIANASSQLLAGTSPAFSSRCTARMAAPKPALVITSSAENQGSVASVMAVEIRFRLGRRLELEDEIFGLSGL
jgi:hypothetical protein